jgi:hypothetical protein
LKTNFHKLIDSIDNDSLLSKFYSLLSQVKETKEGLLWSRLSKEEQEELIEEERVSHSPENLIAHS